MDSERTNGVPGTPVSSLLESRTELERHPADARSQLAAAHRATGSAGARPRGGRAINLLKQIVLVWIQYRHFQAAYAELRRLSDGALSERGLTRADVGRVAFAAAERRAAVALAGSRRARKDRRAAPGDLVPSGEGAPRSGRGRPGSGSPSDPRRHTAPELRLAAGGGCG